MARSSAATAAAGKIAERGREIDDVVTKRRQHRRTVFGTRLLLQAVELHARHDEPRQVSRREWAIRL
jgi:hypothetical protein